ncbi:MAG: hypothetical protein AB7V14_04380 [Kiritimatiellia bacterium]
MKTGKAKWLGLLLSADAAIYWLPKPANAQDGVRELYRKMYEGGLITQAAYEQKTGESAPAIKSFVSSGRSETEGTPGEFVNTKTNSTEKIWHRSLSANGIPATVEQFRQAKREKSPPVSRTYLNCNATKNRRQNGLPRRRIFRLVFFRRMVRPAN